MRNRSLHHHHHGVIFRNSPVLAPISLRIQSFHAFQLSPTTVLAKGKSSYGFQSTLLSPKAPPAS